VDLLLFGDPREPLRGQQALRDALREGRIPAGRFRSSVDRILELRARVGRSG
jgi:hypothetical protein